MNHNIVKNTPELWGTSFPEVKAHHHKYDRGHALIYGASELTGATRLAAESCARMGAGLVSVLAKNNEIANIYRAALPAHILVRDNLDWSDKSVSAKLYGCGGLSIQPNYNSEVPTVLDAGALENLPNCLNDAFILTPHEGEFKKAFPDIEGDKAQRALSAAKQIRAIIVLKGEQTVIAAPDGRVVVNQHASCALSTAGTGDVLAGMITGLVAQGMDGFYASCASVWMHGEAGIRFGRGLVASDIPPLIPDIIKDITA